MINYLPLKITLFSLLRIIKESVTRIQLFSELLDMFTLYRKTQYPQGIFIKINRDQSNAKKKKKGNKNYLVSSKVTTQKTHSREKWERHAIFSPLNLSTQKLRSCSRKFDPSPSQKIQRNQSEGSGEAVMLAVMSITEDGATMKNRGNKKIRRVKTF